MLKRTRIDIDDKPIKKRKLEISIWDILNNAKNDTNDLFVSGSKLKNYLMNDPLIDWLELYYCNTEFNTEFNILCKEQENIQERKQKIENNRKVLQILFDGGNNFENEIMTQLKDKFKNNMIIINTLNQFGLTRDNYKNTQNAIINGVPIIAQAVLYNDKNNTYGIADLLVRSDYLNKIVNFPVLTNDEINIKAPYLEKYHYRVIDIKWTTLHLNAKKDTIRNERFMPAYKGQLAIYNCALGNIQGYFSNQAYILGKGYYREKTENKIKLIDNCNDPFGKFGIIDYNDTDNEYINESAKAIQWYRDVKKNGSLWSPLKPPNANMYPNMCNNDEVWSKIKKEIATHIGEITLICNVGVTQRKILHAKGIFSIHDVKCNSTNMGMNDTDTASRIDDILEINKNKKKISCTKIDNNYLNWQTQSPVDFYIDFETFNTNFMNNTQQISDLVFMIGIGYIQFDKWNYKCLTLKYANLEDEKRLFLEFKNFIKYKSQELDPINKYIPRLFHWTQAEISNFNHVNIRHDNILTNFEQNIVWIDMYYIFKGANNSKDKKKPFSEGICVKGAYNFSLKSIAKAMYSHGFIKTDWEDNNITNGLQAMISSIRYYQNQNNEINKKEFQDIINYNEVDCKVIWEIVEYLRNNHCGIDKNYVPNK